MTHLELAAIIVDEYDPAIGFFVDALGFELVEDSPAVLTVGGFRDAGREEIEMEVALLPGHEYELRLTAKCEAVSGAIGVATSCVYGAKATLADGYVEWEPRVLALVP